MLSVYYMTNYYITAPTYYVFCTYTSILRSLAIYSLCIYAPYIYTYCVWQESDNTDPFSCCTWHVQYICYASNTILSSNHLQPLLFITIITYYYRAPLWHNYLQTHPYHCTITYSQGTPITLYGLATYCSFPNSLSDKVFSGFFHNVKNRAR